MLTLNAASRALDELFLTRTLNSAHGRPDIRMSDDLRYEASEPIEGRLLLPIPQLQAVQRLDAEVRKRDRSLVVLVDSDGNEVELQAA